MKGRVAVALTLVLAACGSGSARPIESKAKAAEHKIFNVGFLSVSSSPAFVSALQAGLAELGYKEGENLRLDLQAIQDPAQLPAIAQRFVAEHKDVIIAGGTVSIKAAQAATNTIPIVMTNSGDPVATGFVKSLAQPGGNITGMSQDSPTLAPKRLEILKQLFPATSKVGALYNPDHPTARASAEELDAAAGAQGLSVVHVEVTGPDMIGPAIDTAKASGVNALAVLRTPFTVNNAKTITQRMIDVKLPAIYETRNYLDDGGLVLYGPSFAQLYRRSATFVDKILKGQSPATIPVEQPSHFEFVVSKRAAAAIGVTLPEAVLVRADDVLE